jgi:phage shock protein E
MIELVKRVLGLNPPVDFKQQIKQGAVILDVRSPQEYTTGHIKNSINIPVNEIAANFQKLPSKDTTIITCCASGMRSGKAVGILKANGYTNVYNGGGWNDLLNKL